MKKIIKNILLVVGGFAAGYGVRFYLDCLVDDYIAHSDEISNGYADITNGSDGKKKKEQIHDIKIGFVQNHHNS